MIENYFRINTVKMKINKIKKSPRTGLYSSYILMFFYIFFLPDTGYSTHIIGGTATYKYLAPNTYEITFTLYNDCFNGNPVAIDDALVVHAYEEQTDSWYQSYTLDHFETKTLINSSNECPWCFEKIIYKGTVILPMTDAYILRWDRCCRPSVINNIELPDETGFVLFTKIPQVLNTSPVFNDNTPKNLIKNSIFIFDGSAVDPDGDSLSYELTEIYVGNSSQFAPVPAPDTTAIPNNPINWVSPYSVNNMLGGIPPLRIDSLTGIITGTPDTVGFFTIAYEVDEFRNSILISTTRKELTLFVSDTNTICTLVGINSIFYKDQNILVYPNPVNNEKATFVFDFNIKEETKFILTNILGRVVKNYEFQTEGNKATIDLSNINNGLYFYTIMVDNRFLKTGKLIISR